MAQELCSLRLRGIEQQDLGFLHHLASRWPEAWPRCCPRGIPSRPELAVALQLGVLAQHLVVAEVSGGPVRVGLVAIYDVDHRHGTAWIERVGLPGDAHDAVMGEALARVIDQAFTTWSFRKLYGTHSSGRAPLFAGLSLAWREEAWLGGFGRDDGLRWDRVTTSIRREDWAAARVAGPAC
jgi:hypothetical protein